MLIGAAAHGRIRHDKAEEFSIKLADLIQAIIQFFRFRVILAHDHDETVCKRRDRERIGNDADGRKVNNDDVKDIAITLEKRAHPLRSEKFRRVRGDIAGRQDIPVAEILGGTHALVFRAQSSHEVGQAGSTDDRQLCGDARHTHISVDQESVLSGLRKRIGQIHGSSRFAFATHRTGHAQDLAFFIRQGKHQVSTKELICLGRCKRELGADHALLLVRKLGRSGIIFLGHQSTPPFLTLSAAP